MRTWPRLRGFTLIELMIVVAVVAVILTLAVPSFRDMILMQRLRGINAQLVTDMAFARGEAISRGTYVQVHFKNDSAMSCYTISGGAYIPGETLCNCLLSTARCTGNSVEIRTVQYPRSESVVVVPRIATTALYVIDPRTGGIVVVGGDGLEPDTPEFEVEARIDATRVFRDSVGKSGRVKVCTPAGSTTGGEAC